MDLVPGQRMLCRLGCNALLIVRNAALIMSIAAQQFAA
jgi:hypothetical protein